MSLYDYIALVSLLSIGLFAGVMMTLVVLLQKQWNDLNKEQYVSFSRGF